MTPRDFLRALAAVLPGRPSPARSAALAQFASRMAADFQPRQLTGELADAVAGRLGETFPTYPDLAAAIRSCMPIEYAVAKVAPSWPPAVQRDEETEDRDWWNARLDRFATLPPEWELAELRGAMISLTGRHPLQRGKFHPRPAITHRVQERIHQLEAEGFEAAEIRPYGAARSKRHFALNDAHGPTPAPPPEQAAIPARHVTGATLDAMRKAAGIRTQENAR